MATGLLPFRGDTSGLIFNAILERAPVSPVRANPDLPVKLEEIINKSLEKDRELRYQHAGDIRADLKRLRRETESGRAVPVPEPPKAGRGRSRCAYGCRGNSDLRAKSFSATADNAPHLSINAISVLGPHPRSVAVPRPFWTRQRRSLGYWSR